MEINKDDLRKALKDIFNATDEAVEATINRIGVMKRQIAQLATNIRDPEEFSGTGSDTSGDALLERIDEIKTKVLERNLFDTITTDLLRKISAEIGAALRVDGIKYKDVFCTTRYHYIKDRDYINDSNIDLEMKRHYTDREIEEMRSTVEVFITGVKP